MSWQKNPDGKNLHGHVYIGICICFRSMQCYFTMSVNDFLQRIMSAEVRHFWQHALASQGTSLCMWGTSRAHKQVSDPQHPLMRTHSIICRIISSVVGSSNIRAPECLSVLCCTKSPHVNPQPGNLPSDKTWRSNVRAVSDCPMY